MLWTPAAINVAAVLLSLFIAMALMTVLAATTSVDLLLHVREVWDKDLRAARAEAAQARRQRDECEQEIARLQAEKHERDILDAENQLALDVCEVSLREAQQQIRRSQLYYERQPKTDEGSGV